MPEENTDLTPFLVEARGRSHLWSMRDYDVLVSWMEDNLPGTYGDWDDTWVRLLDDEEEPILFMWLRAPIVFVSGDLPGRIRAEMEGLGMVLVDTPDYRSELYKVDPSVRSIFPDGLRLEDHEWATLSITDVWIGTV